MEAYNGFAQWVFFGGEGIIAQNDPEAQEKAVKYNDLVATAVAIQNVVDMSVALQGLIEDGFPLTREDVAGLSPYVTRKIKRFGDYVITSQLPNRWMGHSPWHSDGARTRHVRTAAGFTCISAEPQLHHLVVPVGDELPS